MQKNKVCLYLTQNRYMIIFVGRRENFFKSSVYLGIDIAEVYLSGFMKHKDTPVTKGKSCTALQHVQ